MRLKSPLSPVGSLQLVRKNLIGLLEGDRRFTSHSPWRRTDSEFGLNVCIEGHLLRRWWCHFSKHSVYLQATSSVSYSDYLTTTLGESAGPWRFFVSISRTSLEWWPWSYVTEDHYHVFSVWRGVISLGQTEQRLALLRVKSRHPDLGPAQACHSSAGVDTAAHVRHSEL